jgi:hypothetical protein
LVLGHPSIVAGPVRTWHLCMARMTLQT